MKTHCGSFSGRVPPGGLIEWVLPTNRGIENVPDTLKAPILDYMKRVYNVDNSGVFYETMSPKSVHGLETPGYAVWCLKCLGAEDWLTRLRQEGFVQKAIDKSYDPSLKLYLSGNSMDPQRIGAWRLHNDWVARTALDMLNVPARPGPDRPEIIQRFPWAAQSQEDFDAWLDKRWAYDGRAATKEICQYLKLYCMVHGITTYDQWDQRIHEAVASMEKHRDDATGLVGIGNNGDIGWAMRGHRNNIFTFYRTMRMRERVEDQVKIINATLALQHEDGLFHDRNMCAMMDAVELLAEYHLQNGMMYDEIIASVRRCIAGMFEQLRTPDGVFRYDFNKPADTEDAQPLTGTCFVMRTIRYWQAIDPEARQDLGRVLSRIAGV